MSRFGRQHVGSPEHLVDALGRDAALDAADWVLITIPNQLGVELDVKLLAAIHGVGRELGWNGAVTVNASTRTNHSSSEAVLEADGVELLTDEVVAGEVRVPAGAVRVLEAGR